MFSDITKFSSTGDWLYLVTAVCLVDFVVIMLAKYPGRDPYFKVGQLNEWYNRFGVFAVASDIPSSANLTPPPRGGVTCAYLPTVVL
jgi:hypothetical protein